jgi:hypothetical protein
MGCISLLTIRLWVDDDLKFPCVLLPLASGVQGQAEAVDSWGRSNSLGALLVAVPGGPALPFAAAALMGWAGTHGTVLQLL